MLLIASLQAIKPGTGAVLIFDVRLEVFVARGVLQVPFVAHLREGSCVFSHDARCLHHRSRNETRLGVLCIALLYRVERHVHPLIAFVQYRISFQRCLSTVQTISLAVFEELDELFQVASFVAISSRLWFARGIRSPVVLDRRSDLVHSLRPFVVGFLTVARVVWVFRNVDASVEKFDLA